MRLHRFLIAAAVVAALPFPAWADSRLLTMTDVGLALLDGRASQGIDRPLQALARIPNAQARVTRFRQDLAAFYAEYDVMKSAPLTYERVGDNDFDQFFFSSAKTAGTVKTSRKLVDKVAQNMIGLAKSMAAGGELGKAEAMLESDPDSAVQAALAVLQKQKAKLGDTQRDSLFKMLVAMTGTGLALGEATKAIPDLLQDGQRLTAEANPDNLRRRFGMNFGMLAKIPGIIQGTGSSLGALNEIRTDAPALAKNVAVTAAGLASLLE